MKIETTCKELLAPVQSVLRAVARKNSLPILACLLVDCTDESTRITATDLKITLTTLTPLVAKEPGCYAIPAYRLRDILHSLPDTATVVLTVEESKESDSDRPGGRATLRCGRSRFVLSAMSGLDFPVLPERLDVGKLVVTQQALKTAMDRTAYAMAKDDVRYYLNGVMLESKDGVFNLVATDGHRLAANSLIVESSENFNENRELIIPGEAVEVIRKLITDSEQTISLLVSDKSLMIEIGQTRLTTTLVDGRFPDYQRVIPKNSDKIIISDRELLRGMLNRTKLLLTDSSKGVSLSFEPWLIKASSSNSDQDHAEDEIDVNYTGDPLTIGFNAGYFLGALDSVDGTLVKLSLTDDKSSLLLENAEGSSGYHVIMPMRI